MCHIDSFKLKRDPINHTTYVSTVICPLQKGVEMTVGLEHVTLHAAAVSMLAR